MTPKRNPEATCATCPFWAEGPEHSDEGWCQKTPQTIRKYDEWWCGEHPDFFLPLPLVNTEEDSPNEEQP